MIRRMNYFFSTIPMGAFHSLFVPYLIFGTGISA